LSKRHWSAWTKIGSAGCDCFSLTLFFLASDLIAQTFCVVKSNEPFE
jgi:hypothetical protein